jgi:hypothetical protein
LQVFRKLSEEWLSLRHFTKLVTHDWTFMENYYPNFYRDESINVEGAENHLFVKVK